jgi:predicted outer membrane repeat protein
VAWAAANHVNFFGAHILGNVIEDNEVQVGGGGIALSNGGATTIEGNVLRRNAAWNYGGGIEITGHGAPLISQNLIAENSVAGSGGGVVHWIVPSGDRGPLLLNNTFFGNTAPQGSAIHAEGYDSQVVLANNILVSTASQSSFFCAGPDVLQIPSLLHNDVYNPAGPAYEVSAHTRPEHGTSPPILSSRIPPAGTTTWTVPHRRLTPATTT